MGQSWDSSPVLFVLSPVLGPPKSHQRLGQLHTICHLNTETHLGLQISHCREYFSRSRDYLQISDLTLMPLQGQETLSAFFQQSTPKLCVSHSQFTSINDNKFPENFKKWWNILYWEEKTYPNTIFKVWLSKLLQMFNYTLIYGTWTISTVIWLVHIIIRFHYSSNKPFNGLIEFTFKCIRFSYKCNIILPNFKQFSWFEYFWTSEKQTLVNKWNIIFQ